MTCQIIHEDQNGRELERFWVETEVLRIGSDKACQVVIAGLPRQAATVQYIDGQYEVINRSNAPLELNGSRILPNDSASWLENVPLRISERDALRLEFSDYDPSPQPRPSNFTYYEVDDDEPAEDIAPEPVAPLDDDDEPATSKTISAKSVKNGIQLAVTGLCLVGIIVMLAMKGRLGSERPAAPTLTFQQIVDQLMEREQQDPQLIPIRTALQHARQLEIADRTEAAQKAYSHVRDLLTARQAHLKPATSPPNVEQQAWSYALLHLADPGQ